MNAERFQMLIETLERPRPPEIIFDMRTWRSDDDVCGTAACAVGLYVMDHPDEELKASKESGLVYIGLSVHDPESLVGFRACARYWGINYREAEFLFRGLDYGNSCNPTKIEVLDRIRKFYEKRINGDDCITNA